MKNARQQRPTIRKPYERHSSVFKRQGESMTDRSHGNETDVNRIVARFTRTGELPPGKGPGQFADVTNLQGDLDSMIIKGRETAAELDNLSKEQKNKEKQQLKEKLQRLKELEERLDQEDAAEARNNENS